MVNETYGNNLIADWSKIVDYDIENIINSLGYSFDRYDEGQFNFDLIKIYKNSDMSEGRLLLSNLRAPLFMKIQYGKVRTMINFTRKFQMSEYISIPEKDLGAIEYGFDVVNGGYMHFYNKETYDSKYTVGVNPYNVLPDEIKYIEAKEPLSIISEVYMWGSEIRRDLAPKRDIIVKK